MDLRPATWTIVGCATFATLTALAAGSFIPEPMPHDQPLGLDRISHASIYASQAQVEKLALGKQMMDCMHARAEFLAAMDFMFTAAKLAPGMGTEANGLDSAVKDAGDDAAYLIAYLKSNCAEIPLPSDADSSGVVKWSMFDDKGGPCDQVAAAKSLGFSLLGVPCKSRICPHYAVSSELVDAACDMASTCGFSWSCAY